MKYYKIPTNEQRLRRLIFKELNTFEVALLAERIIYICKETMAEIKEKPEKYHNMLIHPSQYDGMCKKAINILEN